jgi:hypothetical protein
VENTKGPYHLEGTTYLIVRTNPGYNNSLSSTATNQWSSQVIKAPAEYELHDKHQHISIPSVIDEEMEEQPRLNRCDAEDELLLWHPRLAHTPLKILQHTSKIVHLPKRL